MTLTPEQMEALIAQQAAEIVIGCRVAAALQDTIDQLTNNPEYLTAYNAGRDSTKEETQAREDAAYRRGVEFGMAGEETIKAEVWNEAIEAATKVCAEWEETFEKRMNNGAEYGASACFRDVQKLKREVN